MTLDQIVERIEAIRDESEQLGAEDTLDETQEARYEELAAEFEELNEQRLKLIQRNETASRILEAAQDPRNVTPVFEPSDSRDPFGEPASAEIVTNRRNPFDLDELRNVTSQAELRSRALDAVELAAGFSTRDRETLTRWLDATRGTMTRHGKALARHIITTSSPDYVRNWWSAIRSAMSNGVANPDAVAYLSGVQDYTYERAMSLTDAAGGFAIPQQLDPALILTSDGTTNSIRMVSRVVQATGDVWTGLSTTHASWSNDAEAAEVSDDATTFAQPSVSIHKAQVFIPFSVEIQGDYPGLEGDLREIIARGKDDLDATNFTTGSGSGQPFGIVTALTGTASEVSSATTDVFAIADVYALDEDLPAKYRSRATWHANRAIANDIRQFDTSGGAGLWTTLGNDVPPLLVGRPFYDNEAMDGVINAAAENYVLVLGDFSNYVVADRVGMTLELVPHLFATGANRPSGQRGFYGWARTGADSVNDGGFSMLNVT